ncbi:unnamed protein product [Nippostrongylus brasiliensis]|uniref:ZP domain-containing protein n=1 Tax=Nippostrongylus brasiliensis TaxID=27835 RepID=A0A0N4XVX8_NIPBR|nr:unnamed protein product [Nippostrongylus brasiliensis]
MNEKVLVQYFFVYGDSDGDYICAQNITFERFNELITGCEQPFAMNGFVTLALMSAVAHLSHADQSLTIDLKNCSRTNPMFVKLKDQQNLTQDLQSLGYNLYFFVYGNATSDGDYICAENITYELYGNLINDCEQPFVLNVDLNDCQILNKVDSAVKDKDEIKEKLGRTNPKGDNDNIQVTEVLLESNKQSFSVYFVNSTPPQHFGFKHLSSKSSKIRPHLISESEYNAYMGRCEDTTRTA